MPNEVGKLRNTFPQVWSWAHALYKAVHEERYILSLVSVQLAGPKIEQMEHEILSISLPYQFEKVESDVQFWNDRQPGSQRRMEYDKNWSSSIELVETFSLPWKDLCVRDKGILCYRHDEMNLCSSSLIWKRSLQFTVQLASWTRMSLHVLVCKSNYVGILSTWF